MIENGRDKKGMKKKKTIVFSNSIIATSQPCITSFNLPPQFAANMWACIKCYQPQNVGLVSSVRRCWWNNWIILICPLLLCPPPSLHCPVVHIWYQKLANENCCALLVGGGWSGGLVLLFLFFGERSHDVERVHDAVWPGCNLSL